MHAIEIKLMITLELKSTQASSGWSDEIMVNKVRSLNVFLTKLLDLKQVITAKYLRMEWHQPIDFFKASKKDEQLFVQLLTRVTTETSIASLHIARIKLAKWQYKYLKFWFSDPFGEFGFNHNNLRVVTYPCS